MSNPVERNGETDGARLSSSGVSAAVIAAVVGTCCLGPVLLPFLLGVLGVGGVARIAVLKTHSGWILITTGLMFAVAFWALYRARSPRAVVSTSEKRPIVPVIAKGALWGCAISWIVALVFFIRR